MQKYNTSPKETTSLWESNTEREVGRSSFALINSNQMNTITSGIVRIEQPGKPEVLRYEQSEIPQPAEGEVLIGQKAKRRSFHISHLL